MLVRLFLLALVAMLSLPQAAMACHQPDRAVGHAAMTIDGPGHGGMHAPDREMPNQPDQGDGTSDLCIGCVAPATLRPAVVAAPLGHRLILAPMTGARGNPLPPPPPATPPPRPMV
ncbi:hypothetical protein ACPVPU_06810 [Sphingomonas sp. CJ99]